MLLCPRLKSVYYARTSYVPTDWQDPNVGITSLIWLTRVVEFHRDQPLELWPPGLQRLRHLAVGVDTGHRLPYSRNSLYPPLLVTQALNLPNLESFYIAGMAHERNGVMLREFQDTVTRGCSNVRHLFLDEFWDLDEKMWEAILTACDNQVCAPST
jgi:hypothetical protein